MEAARKQKIIRIGTSGEYVSYQPNLDDIMNLEGPEVLVTFLIVDIVIMYIIQWSVVCTSGNHVVLLQSCLDFLNFVKGLHGLILWRPSELSHTPLIYHMVIPFKNDDHYSVSCG